VSNGFLLLAGLWSRKAKNRNLGELQGKFDGDRVEIFGSSYWKFPLSSNGNCWHTRYYRWEIFVGNMTLRRAAQKAENSRWKSLGTPSKIRLQRWICKFPLRSFIKINKMLSGLHIDGAIKRWRVKLLKKYISETKVACVESDLNDRRFRHGTPKLWPRAFKYRPSSFHLHDKIVLI